VTTTETRILVVLQNVKQLGLQVTDISAISSRKIVFVGKLKLARLRPNRARKRALFETKKFRPACQAAPRNSL
jgi:hypothetical protein